MRSGVHYIRFVDPSRSLYSYVTDEMFSQPEGMIKSQVIFLYICQLFLIGLQRRLFPVFFFLEKNILVISHVSLLYFQKISVGWARYKCLHSKVRDM